MAFKIWLVLICTATLSGLASFAYRASRSPRRAAVYDRLCADLRLVATRHKLRLALSVLIIGYVQSVIGRNLAFYLHHPMSAYVNDPATLNAHRLYDVGHAHTPDWSGSEWLVSLNELWQYLMAAAVIITAMLPYALELRPDWRPAHLSEGTTRNVFTANVVVRLLQAVGIGHVMRMATFLGTSLPGPSPHCMGTIEARNHPHDLTHVLWFPHAGANCGDLVFSGHMLFATTAVCVVAHYIDVIFGRAAAMRTLMCLVPLFSVQIVTILAARAHYTVDIVTGITIAALLWVVETKVVFTLEWQPNPEHDVELRSASCTSSTDAIPSLSKSAGPSASSFGDAPVTANHSVIIEIPANKAPVVAPTLNNTNDDIIITGPLDPGMSLNSPGLGKLDHPQVGVATLPLPTFEEALSRPPPSADSPHGLVVPASGGATTTPHRAHRPQSQGLPQQQQPPPPQPNNNDGPLRESARRFGSDLEASLPVSAASRAASALVGSSRSQSRR